MNKLRRILLKGISSDEKLDIVSRYARMMVELGKRDPKVRDLAVSVTKYCRGKDSLCEAKTLHTYVRDNVRYVRDIFGVERFATPQRTLFMEKAGDCDDSSIALNALLESIGHETRLILIDPDLSGKFTHVISQVNINGLWYWMETTKKVPFSWAPKFSISHIIDKHSVGEEDMDNLDNLFGIDDLGLGKSRSRSRRSSSRRSSRRSSKSSSKRSSRSSSKRSSKSRTSRARKTASRSRSSKSGSRARSTLRKIRSRASRAVTRASKFHKQASRISKGNTRKRLMKVAQKARNIRKRISQKTSLAKRKALGTFKRKAGAVRSRLQKRKYSIISSFWKRKISKPDARKRMQRLRNDARFASRKLQAEKVKTLAPVVAFEAEKEKELAERQAELENEIIQNAPPEEIDPGMDEPSYADESYEEEPQDYEPEAFTEPDDYADTEEYQDEYPEAQEPFYEEDLETEETELEYEPDEYEDGYEEDGYEENGDEEYWDDDLAGPKRSRKKRTVLLRARARPKGVISDKITKTATLLGGLGIAAWFAKGIIEAKIRKGG